MELWLVSLVRELLGLAAAVAWKTREPAWSPSSFRPSTYAVRVALTFFCFRSAAKTQLNFVL